MNLKKIIDNFRSAPKETRPAVMWFWNDMMDKNEISRQLTCFEQQGIYDIFVNLIWGTTVDYLSDEFFDLVRYAVDECRRLKLNYWIYDEYNWPSGTAGGKLLRDEPWLRAWSLVADTIPVYPGNVVNKHYDGKFERAQLVYQGGRVEDITNEVELEVSEDCFRLQYSCRINCNASLVVMRSRLQQAVLAASLWSKYSFDQPGYIDPFNPEAIRRFIDSTHEKYKNAVGDEFGRTVKGLFTDEVCVASPFDIGRGMIPWKPDLPELFFEQYGYSINDNLYALFLKPESALAEKCRYDFWRLLTNLVRKAHIEQAYTWCEQNNLLYTGHFDGEESLAWDMFQSGDIFELMPYMHIPGIDSIFSRDKINDEIFNTAGKVVASAARFFNRSRTLCETYTGSSWKLRMSEMRRIANRLLFLGANMIQYMGAYYSLDGARKNLPICYPPSHQANNPLFRHYGQFGEYVSRIQYLSSISSPNGRVLMVLPLAGVYCDIDVFSDLFQYQQDSFSIAAYEQAYYCTVNSLLENNVEFDVAGDAMLDRIVVEPGRASLYGAGYEIIIFPHFGKTTQSVIKTIKKLMASGVKVIFIDELPRQVIDNPDLFSQSGEDPFADCQVPAEAGEGLFDINGQQVQLIKCANKKRNTGTLYRELIRKAVGEQMRTLQLEHSGGVYSASRLMNDQPMYFITNDTDQSQIVNGTAPDGTTLILLDPETGGYKSLANRFTLSLKPMQFLALVESNAVNPVAISAGSCITVYGRQHHNDIYHKMVLDNLLTVEAIDGNLLPAQYRIISGNKADQLVACPECGELLECSGFAIPDGLARLGESVTVVWEFEKVGYQDDVTLFAETGDVAAMYLNGRDILGELSPCRRWGINQAEMEIGQYLNNGKNRIVLVYVIPDWAMPHQLPFLMLRGPFEVSDGKLSTPAKIKSIADVIPEKFPYFGGELMYHFGFEKPEKAQKVILALQTEDAAEIIVNGKTMGALLWQPYEIDITEHIKEGINNLSVKCTIPYANLFGDPISCGLKAYPILRLY